MSRFIRPNIADEIRLLSFPQNPARSPWKVRRTKFHNATPFTPSLITWLFNPENFHLDHVFDMVVNQKNALVVLLNAVNYYPCAVIRNL